MLANPIAITEYKPGEGESTVNVYGKLYYHGVPIVVGVVATRGRGENVVTKIRTVHARGDIQKQITDDSILYLGENKKETNEWFQAQGQRVPTGGTKYGFIRSISQKTQVVKKQIKKTSDADYLDAVNRGDMEAATDNIGTFDSTNPDIRYQMKRNRTEIGETENALQKANAGLKADVEHFRRLAKLTEGAAFTKSSVEAAAKWLMNNNDVEGHSGELRLLLTNRRTP